MLLAGCGTNVGARHVGPGPAARQVGRNAITAGVPSASTALVLRSLALHERFVDDPRGTLLELERVALDRRDRGIVFAAAELAFLAARREDDDRGLYLAAACHAWFSLFDSTLGARFDSLDPRSRLAAELYNRSLAVAMQDDRGDVMLAPGPRDSLGRTIELAIDRRRVAFDLVALPRLVPAGDYEVRGLANRHHHWGIGAAMLAVPSRDRTPPQSTKEALTRPTCAGATLLLRPHDGIDAFVNGTLAGTLELRQPALGIEVEIDGRTIPLEFDISATIAYFMSGSKLVDFELPQFLGGGDDYSGILVPMPYAPGRIPVVFVHGTNSSLPRWAGMLNDLLADPTIQQRYQPWFFSYGSGIPVAVSASRLRAALRETRKQLDPEGKDPALDAMIVIGHSQGGLLARQLVVDDPTQELWNATFTKPLAELQLDPEVRTLATEVFFSPPEPYVRRTIYISTPHRGSYQADRWYTRIATGLVSLPADVFSATTEILRQNRDAVRDGMDDRTPGALSGMRTDNPYLLALARLSVASGVRQHVICAVAGDDVPPEGNDGVVEYVSANLESADSSFLVRDSHSCQSNPHVINEVRRILLLHAREFDATRVATPAAPRVED